MPTLTHTAILIISHQMLVPGHKGISHSQRQWHSTGLEGDVPRSSTDAHSAPPTKSNHLIEDLSNNHTAAIFVDLSQPQQGKGYALHVAVVCEAGECCWVKGSRLTWFVVMGRFPFGRVAGCWMAWFVGGRALGRHGLHVAVVCHKLESTAGWRASGWRGLSSWGGFLLTGRRFWKRPWNHFRKAREKTSLGAVGGKHARDKPFPRNPPRNTPKRNLKQNVLKPGAPFCGQSRNRCQKASQKSFLGLLHETCQSRPFQKTCQEIRPK